MLITSIDLDHSTDFAPDIYRIYYAKCC